MPKNIFKNQRNISTTEELQKNVKTINPGIWVLVCAISVFLIGMIVFICTTGYTSTLPVFSYAENGIVYYYVKEENLKQIKIGMEVKYTDCDQVDIISGINPEPRYVQESDYTEKLVRFGNYHEGELIFEFFSGPSTVTAGYHPAHIQIEYGKLIDSFLN